MDKVTEDKDEEINRNRLAMGTVKSPRITRKKGFKLCQYLQLRRQQVESCQSQRNRDLAQGCEVVLENNRTDEWEGLLTLRNALLLKGLQGHQGLREQPGCNTAKESQQRG